MITNTPAPVVPTPHPFYTVRVCDKQPITAHAANTTYTFDSETGMLAQMTHNHTNLLAAPVRFHIWRAPTDNDVYNAPEWIKNYYHAAQCKCLSFACTKQTPQQAVWSGHYLLGGKSRKPALDITMQYTVCNDGNLNIDLHADWCNEAHWLPRFGLAFLLPEGFEQLRYFGLGPTEAYEDKCHLATLDLYNTTVSANHEPYLKPQENGSHARTHWVSVQNAVDHGLLVKAAGNTRAFSFNASHFSDEMLSKAKHEHELIPSKQTFLRVDWKMSGLGSASCGPAWMTVSTVPQNTSTFRCASFLLNWEILILYHVLNVLFLHSTKTDKIDRFQHMKHLQIHPKEFVFQSICDAIKISPENRNVFRGYLFYVCIIKHPRT